MRKEPSEELTTHSKPKITKTRRHLESRQKGGARAMDALASPLGGGGSRGSATDPGGGRGGL